MDSTRSYVLNLTMAIYSGHVLNADPRTAEKGICRNCEPSWAKVKLQANVGLIIHLTDLTDWLDEHCGNDWRWDVHSSLTNDSEVIFYILDKGAAVLFKLIWSDRYDYL